MLHRPKNWKPSQRGETWQGYIRLTGKYDCPYSKSNGRVFEHVYVWWKNNKDPIKLGECLHHINGNKKDNRIENLEKVTIDKHNKIHHKRRTVEEIKAYRKQWIVQHRDIINARRRFLYKTDTKRKEKDRQWVLSNQEKVKGYHDKYEKNNPEKVRLAHQKCYRKKHPIVYYVREQALRKSHNKI